MYCENYMKLINALCRQNVQFSMYKFMVNIVNTGIRRVKSTLCWNNISESSQELKSLGFNSTRRSPLADLGVSLRIMLKHVLKRGVIAMWSGLTYLMVGLL